MSLEHRVATVHVLDCTGAIADDRSRPKQLKASPLLEMVESGAP